MTLVSNHGPVERVPLKVVPMFIENSTVEMPPEPLAPEPVARTSALLPWVGVIAIALAVAAAVVQVVAIVVASAGDFEWGIVLGYLAVILSITAILAGIAAIVVKRDRRAGIVGILLGIIANPLVLLVVLRFFSGTQG